MWNRWETRKDGGSYFSWQEMFAQKRSEKMDGVFFAKFLIENFDKMVKAVVKNSRIWIEDVDPSQNSKLAREAMKEVNSQLLPIPPRSPDITPIENFFGMFKQAFHHDALETQVKVEMMEQFESRIQQIMKEVFILCIDIIYSHYELNRY